MSGVPEYTTPVEVYAGDSLSFPGLVFRRDGVGRDLEDEGWTNWRAVWKKPRNSDRVELTVDASEADVGRILIFASEEVTREMGTSGLWDLQAELNGQVRTFIRGTTSYREDVTL